MGTSRSIQDTSEKRRQNYIILLSLVDDDNLIAFDTYSMSIIPLSIQSIIDYVCMGNLSPEPYLKYVFRNIKIDTLNNKVYFNIKTPITKDQKFIIFRVKGRGYLIGDIQSRLSIMTEDEIIHNIDTIGNARIYKDKLHITSGKIHEATFKALAEYEIQQFNYKADILNCCKLEFNVDRYSNEVKVTNISEGDDKLIIPNFVKSLEIAVFSRNTDIKSVALGDGIKTISKAAFRGCVNLETVKLGKNTTCIESEAFAFCQKLREIKGAESLVTIGYAAFKNTSIKKFIGGNKLKYLAECTFSITRIQLLDLSNSPMKEFDFRVIENINEALDLVLPKTATSITLCSNQYFQIELLNSIKLFNKVSSIQICDSRAETLILRSILEERLKSHSLDSVTAKWIKEELNKRAQGKKWAKAW